MSVMSHHLQHCCGLLELGSLEHKYVPWGQPQPTPTQQIDHMTASLKAAITLDRNSPAGPTGKHGYLFYTTTKAQVLEVEALKATGFKEIDSFINPKTRNKVTLWAYKTVKPASRRKTPTPATPKT